MKSFIVAGLVVAATALPQAASGSECAASVDGTFTITTVKAPEAEKKRALARRQLDGILTMTLKDGVLKDQAGREGYIASNYQYVSTNILLVTPSQPLTKSTDSSSTAQSKTVPSKSTALASAATTRCR